MLFNSPVYGAFLFGAFALYWALRKRRTLRALFLVAASYAFYFYGTYDTAREQPVPASPLVWALLCLGIIFLGSSLDFVIGRRLGVTRDPRKRKALLLVSIAFYLGLLGLFKYANFAMEGIASLAALLGIGFATPHLQVVLPFGISFFTFETMSYTIDVYRGELQPKARYLDYLLFVCFFPHLVSGPIVRPHEMLPQLERSPQVDLEAQARGLLRIGVGVMKKVVLGDYLSHNLVRRVFENPERFSSLEVLMGVYAYAVYIYVDFSGYTDIALGSASLFGLELPENFDAPYASSNLQEFWRRWHMSLSRWLRDYLYIPLGGSKHGSLRTYRNLFLTMVLGGLWHGANATFVVWGALHGGMLAVTRMWQRWRGESTRSGGWSAVVATGLTFHFVCFAWIFFGSKSVAHAFEILVQLSRCTLGVANLSGHTVALIVIGLALHFVPRPVKETSGSLFARSPALVQGLVLVTIAILVRAAAGRESEPFVYGQF